MKVVSGDIVFALTSTGRMWPARVLTVGVMAQVKFFRIKGNFKVPNSSVESFSEENQIKYGLECRQKSYVLACKMAEKAKLSINNKSMAKKIEESIFLIKQEEDGVNCKQQEDDDQKRQIALPHFPCFFDYILNLDERKLLNFCTSNFPRQFIFFSQTQKKPQKHIKRPLDIIVILLEYYLTLMLDQDDDKLKAKWTAKLSNILTSKVIQLQVCFKNKRIMYLVYCNRKKHLKYKQIDAQIGKFMSIITNFCEQMEQKLNNYIQDYTTIAEIIQPLQTVLVQLQM